jgi:hypothetical protein
MPKLAAGLIYCAMLVVYEDEKEQLHEYQVDSAPKDKKGEKSDKQFVKLGPLGSLILLMLSHLYDLKNFTLNIPHYF